MITYGVTDAGFIRKPLSQIVIDLRTRFQSTFGVNSDYSDDSPFGQIIADVSAMIDEPWQIGEDVYFSLDPDQATGARLNSLSALTGTVPKIPTKSTTIGVAIGAVGSFIASKTKVQVVGGGSIYQTTEDAVISALAAWISYTAQIGDLRTNVGNIYYCIVGGATAGSGGPTGTGTDIIDGSAHWRYLGSGISAVAIPMESVDYGIQPAGAGALTVVLTPASGLASFTNPIDAVMGQPIETGTQLRQRRTAELTAAGEGGIESMRADLLRVSGVTDGLIFENNSDVVDGNGLLPHSIEALALGGSDLDVAKVVFTHGAGISTNGSTTVNITDSMGVVRPIKFSRPTPVNIWVIVNLTKNAQYPSDGDQRVKQSIVDFANGLLASKDPDWVGFHIGDDVIQSQLYGPIFDQVPGVVDITKIWIGLVNPPTGPANIVTAARELPKFDVSRITVVSV